MATYRQYTEDDKAVALAYFAACGGNQLKTSRDCGIPLSTLQDWIKGDGVNCDIVEKAVYKGTSLADKFEELANLLMDDAIEKRENASFAQTMIGVAIATDKMQLLRKLPTSINEQSSLTDDERIRKLSELHERVRDRVAGLATVSGTEDQTQDS